MKKILLGLLIVVVLLVVAAVTVPFFIPMDTYKSQIEARVEAATGRQLTIEGPLELSVLPSLAVQMDEVRFANSEGGINAEMATLGGVEVALKPLPLLTGTVEIDRFVLREPAIHLEVDAAGRANWQFGEAAAEPAPAEGDAGGGSTLPITDLKLGDIRIENGTLTYSDAQSGASETIEQINMQLELADLRSPLSATGALDYKGQTVNLGLDVENPYALLVERQATPVGVRVNAEAGSLRFGGELANQAEPSASGEVELSITSIRDLAAWLATPLDLEGDDALQTLAIKGQLLGSPQQVAFTGATLSLDQITGTGEVSVALGGPVPEVSGRLDLGAVDLNPYLPAAAAEETAGTEQAGGGGEAPAAAEGWSDEPLAVPPLGVAKVDFELTLEQLLVQQLKLDRTVLGLTLDEGGLIADLKEFGLYQGRGSGRLKAAPAGQGLAIASQFKLDDLAALPFLTDAAEFERLEGTASASFDLAMTGGSQKQLVESLGGDGEVMFRDGAIRGINLAAMVRNASTAFLDASAGEARKTDFAELSGSFTVADGILTNRDMTLQAPVLRIGGSGTVDLPQRTVDYRIEPKAAATLEGQGGQQDVAGLLVPVVITGPWDDLSYKPDLEGLARRALEDPEALKRQLDQLGESGQGIRDALGQIEGLDKQGAVEGLVNQLTRPQGGQEGNQQGGQQQAPAEAAQELLKGLFGR